MKNLRPLLSNAAFAIQILLLFLWIFEGRVNIPIWLQPIGRMHPLLLHFPIVLWILLAVLPFLKKQFAAEAYEPIQNFLLHLAVIMTSLTALMGFFLMQEGGYGSEAMNWHKWGGMLMSFLGYGVLVGYPALQQRTGLFQGILAAGVVLLVGASHFGAELTHGENFVFAPLQLEEEDNIDPAQPIAQEMVLRVLDSKCASCHNPRKSKGELDMSTLASLFEGGEHGAVIKAGDIGESSLIQRVFLPEDDEEHMPPEGKPQLNAAEIDLLQAWIDQGASKIANLTELEETNPLHLAATRWMASQGVQASKGPSYAFEAASPKLIEELNTPFRRISPISANSPALEATIFVRSAYTPQQISDLNPLREQLISLNLSQLPITDSDLKLVSNFTSLEKLWLNGTDISSEGLKSLANCDQLRSLALSSTQVGPELTDILAQWENLREVFVWNTQLDTSDLQAIASQYPEVQVEMGYLPDPEEILQMSRPQLVTEKRILGPGDKIEFKHNFPGVQIRYTTDGTEPDSLTGTLYSAPFESEGFAQVKAIAYLDGWISSGIVSQTFFGQGVVIAQAELATLPNKQYDGSGALTLIDTEKGDPSAINSPLWLGYRDKPLEAVLDLGEDAPTTRMLTFSYLQKTGSWVMPPRSVEVWGGKDKNSLRRLAKTSPRQPRENTPDEVKALQLDFEPETYRYFRIVANPVSSLPSWHQGAGQKGWVFTDEVMVY